MPGIRPGGSDGSRMTSIWGLVEGETSGSRTAGGVGDPRRTASSEAIEFAERDWNVATIRERFRSAVDSFAPDYVVISDTWNMKPHLAEAMRGYPCVLHVQALECLCPLNNLRLIGIGPTQVEQCPRNQLATPQVCHQCLAERGHHAALFTSMNEPLPESARPITTGSSASRFTKPRPCWYSIRSQPPWSSRMRGGLIVPWGIDSARFPWPEGQEVAEGNGRGNSSPIAAPGSPAAPDSGDRRTRHKRNRQTRTQRTVAMGTDDSRGRSWKRGDPRSCPRAGSGDPRPARRRA